MKKPKIVLWDLETLPDPRKIYDRIPSIGAWPGRTLKAELQSIITFGYKIYGEKRAKSISSWDFKNWKNDRHDDSAVVAMAYEILVDADEIVTHNGKSFDVKVLNTRLAYHGLPPLPKIHHVDTKIAAKSGLSLYSNSLAEVAKFFNVEDKMTFNNKWNLWTRIAFGDSSSKDLKLMSKYCEQDVEVLEQVYEKLRPFHGQNSINKNFFADRVCPTCGGNRLHKHGKKRTRTKEYIRLLCQDCGSVSQESSKGVIT